MHSIEQMQDIQREAAARAAQEGLHPLVSWPEDDARALGKSMPFLGDYVPEGWQMVDDYFVDSSGFGREGELALTLGQFDLIVQEHVGSGWAVVEAGEFQVVIGRYVKAHDCAKDMPLEVECGVCGWHAW